MRRLGPLVSVVTLVLAACGGGGGSTAGPPAATTSSPAPPTTPAPSPTTPTTLPPLPQGPVVSGFIAFGDFGGGAAQLAVAGAMDRWAAAHRVDALVTTGDNVYPTGEPSLYKSELDDPYRALRATRPLWIALGNHDVGAGHGAAMLAHLGLPALPYEKTLPNVQLLFLDANHPDAAQASWLDAALAKPGPPFRIVVFHQPAWSCGLHGSTPDVDRFWVPVIEKHRVSLVLNGHDHDYERFTSGAGVTYVVTGGGGQNLYPLVPCAGTPKEDAQAQKHHFTGVEVTSGTLAMTAIGTDGGVIDRTVLTR
jgi:3',5'-cyclic AMP phosphodiesterase CpdA